MTSPTAPLLSALVPTEPGTRLTVEQTITAINEEVAIKPLRQAYQAATPPTSHQAVAAKDWDWRELRDYVVFQIEAVHGPTPRQAPYKEQAIFEGFLNRHKHWASRIAIYAFEVAGGYWKNAPISVNRFCRSSDMYFADVIRRHLDEVDRAADNRV